MKKIGKEVLFIKTGGGRIRCGEGAFLRLKNGDMLYAYTEYYGDCEEDHGMARISAFYSSDEGETWRDGGVLLEKDTETENIMSVSLLRLQNGDLGLLYLQKQKVNKTGISCVAMLRRSADEGKTFSEAVSCSPTGYWCGINDGVLQTKDGRIIMPLSYHGEYLDVYGSGRMYPEGVAACVRFTCSEDDGRTWQMLPGIIQTPYADAIGFAEPGVYEIENGELWAYFRTAYGHQYQSFSKDGGVTWSAPIPNFCFTSPDAPMRVRQIGDFAIAVFNPKGYDCLRDPLEAENWKSPKRTPLVCSVSQNGASLFDTRGKTIAHGELTEFTRNSYLLEEDPKNSYCYPAITPVQDGFLVAYYHSGGTNYCLNCGKIQKVYWEELDGSI